MSANANQRQRRQRPLGSTDLRQPAGKRQGLTRTQIAAALEAQGGRCLVGGEPLGSWYAVDHCHQCARLHGHAADRGCPACFRGLLCAKHNSALGTFGDDVEGLLRAARYVAHGVHRA